MFWTLPGGAIIVATGVLASITSQLSAAALVIGGVASVTTIAGVVWGVRYRIAYEVEVKAREGVQALADAEALRVRQLVHEREELAERLERVSETLREAQRTIEQLSQLPNLERVLKLMSQTYERIEEKSVERHETLLSTQEEILRRLPPRAA